MSEATDMLALYIAAEKKVLTNQSYTLNGVTVTRSNLPEIRKGRAEWQARVNAEKAKSQGGSNKYSVADFN